MAGDRLEELDAAMAFMAHELRTPLTIMKAWADTLSKAARKMDQETLLTSAGAISRSADQMEDILRNMSDVGAISSGHLKLDLNDALVSDLIQEVVDDLAQITGGHDLGVSVQDDVLIRIDSARVRQILINLLTNAIKFSPPGAPVQIGVIRSGDAVQISVSDEGEGIPAERYEELFQRYSRLGAQVQGTGLGLYISREIARAHGGDLALTSDADEPGCSFVLELPIHGQATEGSLAENDRKRPR